MVSKYDFSVTNARQTLKESLLMPESTKTLLFEVCCRALVTGKSYSDTNIKWFFDIRDALSLKASLFVCHKQRINIMTALRWVPFYKIWNRSKGKGALRLNFLAPAYIGHGFGIRFFRYQYSTDPLSVILWCLKAPR